MTDSRYVLTELERRDVVELKQACDEAEVAYSSIFELAKYVIVCHSIEDQNKRIKEAFSRIKGKREFELKHNLDALELLVCAKEMDNAIPDWAVVCGKLNSKQVIGYSSHNVSSKYLRKKGTFQTICKVEFARYDLAAVDLEEARNGFYIVASSRGLPESPLRLMKPCLPLRVLFGKIHANKIKGLFFEINGLAGSLMNILKQALPSKLKERLKVAGNMEKLRQELDVDITEWNANISPALSAGGEYQVGVVAWIKARQKLYKESADLITL